MGINKRGSVLIFVLMFIAFAASTVLLIHENSTKSIENASADFYENQSNIYAMTALNAVLEALKDDDDSYDTRRDSWAAIPMVEIPYGYISVSITPVNSKMSLNNMRDPKHNVAARYLLGCRNLMESLELDAIDCGEIKDYIDRDTDLSEGGAEGATYEINGITFHTKDGPMKTLYELKMLMNNNEEFNIIKDYVTVYNPKKAININWASEETIAALLPELEPYAKEIVSYAKANDMKDPSNIQEATDVPKDVLVAVLPYITVKSTLFYVKTEVTLNDVSRYYHALVHRDGNASAIVNFLAGLNGYYY